MGFLKASICHQHFTECQKFPSSRKRHKCSAETLPKLTAKKDIRCQSFSIFNHSHFVFEVKSLCLKATN